MQDAETDLSLVIDNMAANFFPWKDPRTDLQRAVPWIQVIITGLLGFIPYAGAALSAAAGFADWSPGLVSSTQNITSSGVRTPIRHTIDTGLTKILALINSAPCKS
jgi:hypothetical protein